MGSPQLYVMSCVVLCVASANLSHHRVCVCCACVFLQSLCARTPLEHRRYLSQRRQVTRLKTEPYRFNLPGAEPPSPSPASPTPEQLFMRPISPDDGVGALPLSASQVQMKQNIAAINNRVTDVDGILFKIDYEPLGSKQRIKRSVCKLKTF
jgi:hypothetical protein